MPGILLPIHYHRSNPGAYSVDATFVRTPPGSILSVPASALTTAVSAARYHLNRIFEQDRRPDVRGLAAPEDPGVVPSLQFVAVHPEPKTETRTVHFVQMQSSIPVFGSKVVVELGPNQELVSVNGELGDLSDSTPFTDLSAAQALEKIAQFTGRKADALGTSEAPPLNFYKDDDGTWRLVYLFRRVPAAPSKPDSGTVDSGAAHSGHGLALSPRELQPQFDYLVDAHDGEIVFYYSSDPMMAPPQILASPASPVRGEGLGEDESRSFFLCRQSEKGSFEMFDPIRMIAIYDVQLDDLSRAKQPKYPVSSSTGSFAGNKAAVSAHVNLRHVWDFYNSVLARDGIDGKRMPLIGIINCTYSLSEPAPVWRNAVWYKNCLWFGQAKDESGVLHSFSRHLDVIAHELTHGVTEYTCNLVYREESGALNESLSDIFGIVVKNWHEIGPDSDPRTWDWKIGSGLGANGVPLRDLSDPAITGDPAHMDRYVITQSDNGGVHTNSNIHNKAAYNLLTAQDAQGGLAFRPSEVALFYYLSMIRLSRLAGFSKMLAMLKLVATTYFDGNSAERRDKLALIERSYQQVGIEEGQL